VFSVDRANIRMSDAARHQNIYRASQQQIIVVEQQSALTARLAIQAIDVVRLPQRGMVPEVAKIDPGNSLKGTHHGYGFVACVKVAN
jgi:hypothetical protein